MPLEAPVMTTTDWARSRGTALARTRAALRGRATRMATPSLPGHRAVRRPLARPGAPTRRLRGAHGGVSPRSSASVAAWMRRSGRDLPERVDAGDLVLVTVATHKASRLIAKDRVTSTARAPFTRFEDDAGPGEVRRGGARTRPAPGVGELRHLPLLPRPVGRDGPRRRPRRRAAPDAPGGLDPHRRLRLGPAADRLQEGRRTRCSSGAFDLGARRHRAERAAPA